MKNLILLFLFSTSLFCNNAFSQNSKVIKSVNLHEILNNITTEIMEKGYDTNTWREEFCKTCKRF